VTAPSEGNDGPRTARWLEVIADPIRLAILRSLSHVEEATASDLADWSQASSQTLRRHLEALVSLGVIREHPARSDGESPGRPPARFSMPAETRASVRSVLATSEPAPASSPGPLAQAVEVPSAASLASMNSIAAVGPMNGANAT
jgi:DNA-binding transcriptional ArsR family regulator